MNIQDLFGHRFLCSSRRIFTGVLQILFVFLVAGCSHDFVLRKPDGTVIGPGIIDFSQGNSAGIAQLESKGIIYRGHWESHKVDESRSIVANYGLNSRKYQEYSLGRGTYLWEGQASLHSDQGEVLKCGFSYRGVSGRGKCRSGSDEFDFIIAEYGQSIRDVPNY